MKWIVKLIIFSLIVQFAIPQYLQIEIVRTTAFVEHFLHHYNHDHHIQFDDFVHEHYSHSQHHEDDHNEHEKLPFHNHSEKCTIGQIPIALVNSGKFHIEAVSTNGQQENILYDSPFLPFPISSSIWRPPRLS